MNKLHAQDNRCVLYGTATLGTLQVTDSVEPVEKARYEIACSPDRSFVTPLADALMR